MSMLETVFYSSALLPIVPITISIEKHFTGIHLMCIAMLLHEVPILQQWDTQFTTRRCKMSMLDHLWETVSYSFVSLALLTITIAIERHFTGVLLKYIAIFHIQES